MAITRTPMTDDDGTGTTGTVINAAWKTELYDQIDAALVGIPPLYATLNNGAVTVPPSAWYPVPLPTILQDQGGFTGVANQLIIPAGGAGLYLITINFNAFLASPPAGTSVATALVQDGTRTGESQSTMLDPLVGAGISFAIVRRFSPGTSTSMHVYQTTGVSIPAGVAQLSLVRLAL